MIVLPVLTGKSFIEQHIGIIIHIPPQSIAITPRHATPMCFPRRKRLPPDQPPLNILLTNGRFPVSIDLARQLTRVGHNVYVVDPMHYHVCKFSNAVRKSWWAPAPHVDGRGYVEKVLEVMSEVEEKGAKPREASGGEVRGELLHPPDDAWPGEEAAGAQGGRNQRRRKLGRRKLSSLTRLGVGGSGVIDLVIPMHEEIFYLAEACWFGGFVPEGGEAGGAAGEENPGEQGHKSDADAEASSSSSASQNKQQQQQQQQLMRLNPGSLDKLSTRLLAPPFPTLIMLHNKHTWTLFLQLIGLDYPAFRLCKDKSAISSLLDGTSPINPSNPSASIAIKPVFGRACSNVYHVYPLALSAEEKAQNEDCLRVVDVSPDNHYLAQEWLTGDRYCTYGIIQSGRAIAFGVYPVKDTIDGSSCTYFQSVNHPRIKAYVDRIASALADVPGLGYQLAFDFIETDPDPCDGGSRRLVAIECNPRATSGIHLFNGTTKLAEVFASTVNLGSEQQAAVVTPPAKARQLAPGMLMWKPPTSKLPRTPSDAAIGKRIKMTVARGYANVKQYMSHMRRLMGSKDVMFSKRDLAPSLMQPFLLTSYYELCRERKMKLPEMFQWDLTWEPCGEQVLRARRVVEDELARRREVSAE